MTAPAMSLDRPGAERLAERLRHLAQPQRLMILSLLAGHGNRGQEYAVGDIEALTGIGQPALSQQLAELRRAGLVATRRQGRLVRYRLAEDECGRQARAILGLLHADFRTDGPAGPASVATPERAPEGAPSRDEAPGDAAGFVAILPRPAA
ncbi:ArsR/SmtB family transcription factor [Nguyenibacter vanlangensis]